MTNPNDTLEDYLQALVDELEIPETRYAQASDSYESFGKWLHRPESTVLDLNPDVYLQGSFKLGTVIKPKYENDEYDIDSVCLLQDLSKTSISQAALKTRMGVEVKSYHKSQSMVKPIKDGNRCWTLQYADGAKFHMDILPAVPNGNEFRKMLEERNLDTQFSETAIAITCKLSASYHAVSGDWPRSNPKGYAQWFKSRIEVVFNQRRQALFEKMLLKSATASIEQIPDYAVRTPLQSVIMILKHHRDEMFEDEDPDLKPISIIITTLSAHAYGGEGSLVSALKTVLSRMEDFITHDGTKYIVANPTDPMENFADKWKVHPERQTAFFDWLRKAQRDFLGVLSLNDRNAINEQLSKSLGGGLSERVLGRMATTGAGLGASVGLLQPASAAPDVSSSASLSFSDQRREPLTPKDFA